MFSLATCFNIETNLKKQKNNSAGVVGRTALFPPIGPLSNLFVNKLERREKAKETVRVGGRRGELRFSSRGTNKRTLIHKLKALSPRHSMSFVYA